MEQFPGPRQPGGRRGPRARGGQRPGHPPTNPPQLFDDTSAQPGYPPYGANPEFPAATQFNYNAQYHPPQQGAAYGAPPNNGQQGFGGTPGGASQFPGGQDFLKDPMANMAMQYGTNLAGQGKEMLQSRLGQYVSSNKLKVYFAVDTSYVGKKLGLLLFPYAHTDWSIRYSPDQDDPGSKVAPRYEVNAPDLYIPVMAFVTYILIAGIAIGTQNKFSPEQLGITASTALIWMVLEVLFLLVAMYILNVSTDLSYLDLLSYCGYKYVGMIAILVVNLAFHTTGYYAALLWMSIAICFFLVRSLKFAIVPHADQSGYTQGSKRRLYMLLVIALSQPLFMWWLTRHLAIV